MTESNVLRINEAYDSTMFSVENHGDDVAYTSRFTDRIGFFNLGYWSNTAANVELAQLNLIETLVSFFVNKEGNVLDVACGKGASTKFLTKYFDPRRITAINISEKQLEFCRLVAPGCDFRLMDATSLRFPGASFDNMLCIEAAFHFQTREQFFQEACRVLKPGGRLAMSDLLHDRTFADRWGGVFPEENHLESLDNLRTLLLKAGFRYVRVDDTTDHCIKPFFRYLAEQMERDEALDPEKIGKYIQVRDHYIASCNAYAIK